MEQEKFNAFIEKVKAANRIEEVVPELLGRPLINNKAVCPFHSDHNPSLSIVPAGQYFNCFGCKTGGDVFKFVKLIKKTSFRDALKYLCERAGIEIPWKDGETVEEPVDHIVCDALFEAARMYNSEMPVSFRGKLNEMGLSNDIIDYGLVGFCAGTAVAESKLKTDMEVLQRAGLVDVEGREVLGGCFTFPNIVRGRVVDIGGLSWPELKPVELLNGENRPRHLYAEKFLDDKEATKVILVPDQIDALTLIQNKIYALGYVGGCEKAIRTKLVHCDTVFLCNGAGETERETDLALAEMIGRKAKIVCLPDGWNFNAFFMANTREEFEKILDNSSRLIEFMVKSVANRLRKTKTDKIDKAKIFDELKPIVHMMVDLDEPEINAIFYQQFKEEFKLTNREVEGYVKYLTKIQEERIKLEQDQPTIQTQNEIIAALKNSDQKPILCTAQDYHNGVMHFAVVINGETFIMNSERKIHHVNDESQSLVSFKHDKVDRAKFSYKGIMSFIDGTRTVKLSELYLRVYEYIRSYIHLPCLADVSYLALWLIGTYVFRIFRNYPYVWLHADKGSGKSMVMQILAPIAFNGELTIIPTSPLLYRLVEINLSTIFFDEAEHLRKKDSEKNPEIMAVLNSGYNKATSILRLKLDERTKDYNAESFTPFAPKMLASINDIHDVVKDRAKVIKICKKCKADHIDRYVDDQEMLACQESLRDALYICALTYCQRIAAQYSPKDKKLKGADHLDGRELDLWEPIFSLANIIDEENGNNELTSMMTELSKDASQDRQKDNEENNQSYRLLSTIPSMLEELASKCIKKQGSKSWFLASDIFDYIKKVEGFEYLENFEKNMLTKLLKTASVVRAQLLIKNYGKVKKESVYIFDDEKLMDLYKRYSILRQSNELIEVKHDGWPPESKFNPVDSYGKTNSSANLENMGQSGEGK